MRTYKSMLAWQKARQLVDVTIRIAVHHWSPPAGAVIHQLQRSALSSQLNIAEGYALRSTARFLYHLNVAYGSAVESGELLELLNDHRLAPEDLVQTGLRLSREVQALTLTLVHKLARWRATGH
jgi:four helix bundle protein